MDRDLDSISGEIYAQTVYDPAAKRISTLKLTPEDYVHRVHVTGGFAKDFSLSGFRVGFVHSYNTALVACMRELSYFACVSSHTQALLAALLADPDIHGIIAASNAALKKCHAWFVSMLARHGIAAAPAQAGVFVMADFSRHLEGDGEEAEMTLWRHLYDRLKLNISPGHMFGAERCGQFRMCFAQPTDMLEELDRRLEGLKQY